MVMLFYELYLVLVSINIDPTFAVSMSCCAVLAAAGRNRYMLLVHKTPVKCSTTTSAGWYEIKLAHFLLTLYAQPW